jgi:hypothetical protein
MQYPPAPYFVVRNSLRADSADATIQCNYNQLSNIQGVQQNIFVLGLSPKLWVGGGQKS